MGKPLLDSEWPGFLSWYRDWSDRMKLDLINPFRYKFDLVQMWRDGETPKWNEKYERYSIPIKYKGRANQKDADDYDKFLSMYYSKRPRRVVVDTSGISGTSGYLTDVGGNVILDVNGNPIEIIGS